MYIIYIKIIFIRLPEQACKVASREARPRPLLPDPLMLPVGENKGELSAVADPDRIRTGGGGVGRSAKIFLWSKNKGGPGPPSRSPRSATDQI